MCVCAFIEKCMRVYMSAFVYIVFKNIFGEELIKGNSLLVSNLHFSCSKRGSHEAN